MASNPVTLTIHYEAGHSYDETWAATNFYCPVCGKQPVWGEQGPGDYYEGSEYLCLTCGTTFTLPSCSDVPNDNKHDVQRLAGIRQHLEINDGK